MEGNWRKEHLITIKQSFELYNFIQQQIIDCEKEIELTLQNYMASKNDGVIESDEEIKKKPKKKSKNHPLFNTQGCFILINNCWLEKTLECLKKG